MNVLKLSGVGIGETVGVGEQALSKRMIPGQA
jgi:hypothetical protein